MNAPTTPSGIQHIALDQLYLHDLNPRPTVTEAEIADMATTIGINGLLQNLIGYKDPARDGIGIVGGGRRLRALQLLAAQGAWTGAVPLIVFRDANAAITASAAENEARVALSPSDEIRLYARLKDNALTPAAIARAHGVTERHVKQRLRLASLPAPVLEALDDRAITLDQAQAFTVSDDEAAILDMLDTIRGRDYSPHWIRSNLVGKAVPSTDPRALYVGEAAYVEGGGRITRDLFSDADLWLDQDILIRVANDMLATAAAAIRTDEGWHEVHHIADSHGPNFTETDKLQRIWPTPVDLPESDAAELEALSEMADRTPEEDVRKWELEARARGDFSDDQRATGIIWVHINRQGRMVRAEAWTRKTSTRSTDTDPSGTATKADEAPTISQALREDLNRIATGALQAAMLDRDNLDLALALLTYEARAYSFNRVASFQIHEPPNMPTVTDGLTLPDAVTEISTDIPDKPTGDGLGTLLEGKADDFLRTLQAMIARSIVARFDEYGRAVMAKAGIDIRAHWTPTATNFFGRCPPKYLDALYAEIAPDTPDDTKAAFAAMKKADKAEVLEKIFANDPDAHQLWRIDIADADQIATWLPAEIRTEGNE